MRRPTTRLQLETLFILDDRGRLRSTREPQPSSGPAFYFVRGAIDNAWAIRADVDQGIAEEIDGLASQEPSSADWNRPLLHAAEYVNLLGGRIRSGPAFEFPEQLRPIDDAIAVHDEALLDVHFSGWVHGEIDAGRSPVMAVYEKDHPVSICFCARRSSTAAEAGIETAVAYRGRGYAPRVATAWAAAVRAAGLIPIYSANWENHASLAVARKLGLVPFAADFRIEP